MCAWLFVLFYYSVVTYARWPSFCCRSQAKEGGWPAVTDSPDNSFADMRSSRGCWWSSRIWAGCVWWFSFWPPYSLCWHGLFSTLWQCSGCGEPSGQPSRTRRKVPGCSFYPNGWSRTRMVECGAFWLVFAQDGMDGLPLRLGLKACWPLCSPSNPSGSTGRRHGSKHWMSKQAGMGWVDCVRCFKLHFYNTPMAILTNVKSIEKWLEILILKRGHSRQIFANNLLEIQIQWGQSVDVKFWSYSTKQKLYLKCCDDTAMCRQWGGSVGVWVSLIGKGCGRALHNSSESIHIWAERQDKYNTHIMSKEYYDPSL